MRHPLLRFLSALLVLALVGGNLHAWHYASRVSSEPCESEGHTGAAGGHHDGTRDLGCCCDCLGCIAAMIPMPDLPGGPSEPFALVHYALSVSPLSDRTLPPDPDPPKPSALS